MYYSRLKGDENGRDEISEIDSIASFTLSLYTYDMTSHTLTHVPHSPTDLTTVHTIPSHCTTLPCPTLPHIGTAAFIDAEHALDPVYAKNLGVNVDDLLVCQVGVVLHADTVGYLTAELYRSVYVCF